MFFTVNNGRITDAFNNMYEAQSRAQRNNEGWIEWDIDADVLIHVLELKAQKGEIFDWMVWFPEDVAEALPEKSKEELSEWTANNRKYFAEAMIEQGYETMRQLD